METKCDNSMGHICYYFYCQFFLNIGNYFLELTIIPDSIQNQRNHQHVQVLKTGVGQISGQQL
jgi:hypothetical protein